jgi:hypothetical protein
MRHLLFLTILTLAGTMVTGCESPPEEIPAPPPITKLQLDPTDEYEIGRWWSNGQQLLRLDTSGSYALYPGMNRYAAPVERGRWSQQSYAMLRLEPYERFEREWIRVAVTRLEGRIALTMLDKPAMFDSGEPPVVREDRLVGRWQGELGAVELRSDGSYHYSASRAAVTGPIVIAGHDGRWLLEGDRVMLNPTPPAMTPIDLWIEASEGRTILAGPGGVYEREPPAAPPVS